MPTLNSESAVSALSSARDAKLAAGGSFRLTDFLHEVGKFAEQAIDTPEERKGIVDGAMSFYDSFVTSHVPALFRDKTREFVLESFSAALLAASTL